jgi:hypothetical protein
MVKRPDTVNPIAKALLQTHRRRQQVVPDKTKYNRKKENKDHANQSRKHEASDAKD